MKNILKLNSKSAKEFFMKNESYITTDLPDYFNFSNLLQTLDTHISGKSLKELILDQDDNNNPSRFENVNYTLLSNKDGKYSWRPIQLINPLLYVYLINLITKKDNWKYILTRIDSMVKSTKNIYCMSWPIVSGKFKKNKANQIIDWNDNVTKRSIKNSLKYDYLYITDLSDCYGTIYTHAISWALHSKAVSKDKSRPKNLVGDDIDKLLQSMSNGQTNGIPQGSALMDFIAEIFLCYLDSLLSFKIAELDSSNFEIVRYRDDYRIFVDNPKDGEHIIKALTEILNSYGMKINSSKTEYFDNIIRHSIKQDKYQYLINSDINEASMFRSLLKINDFTDSFCNSKITTKLLQNFYYQNYFNFETIENDEIYVLISILINISFKNPTTYPMSFAIVSRLLDQLNVEIRSEVVDSITKKFNKLPNTGLMEIWLQRICIPYMDEREYEERLCQKVTNLNISLWNTDWLNTDIKNYIDKYDVVDRNILSKMGAIVEIKEIELFDEFEYF